MQDPLTRALDEKPAGQLEPAPETVAESTAHPQPVRDILEHVREQAVAAFAIPFFDGADGSRSEPVVKVGVAEAGTIRISAERIDPPYRAELTLFVRGESHAEDEGQYELHGRCELTHAVDAGHRKHDFAIGLTIDDAGMVTIDVEQLQSELVQAIRLIS